MHKGNISHTKLPPRTIVKAAKTKSPEPGTFELSLPAQPSSPLRARTGTSHSRLLPRSQAALASLAAREGQSADNRQLPGIFLSPPSLCDPGALYTFECMF